VTSEILGKYITDYTTSKIPHTLGPLDSKDVPLFDPRHFRLTAPPVYHPVVIMQHALAHSDLMLDGHSASEKTFMRCARWVEDNAIVEPENRFLVWRYTFPIRTPRVRPGWISGMAQGQGLSVLARSFLITRSSKTADIAQRAAQSFLYAVGDGGVVTKQADGTCFIEEIAAPRSLHILNGCLYGLFGLVEHLRLFPDSRLQLVLEACTEGINHLLPSFDTGYWSRYSLGIRWNLASIYYHTTHIRQLRHLGKLLDNRLFLHRADLWEGYTKSKTNRSRYRATEFVEVNANRAMTILRLDLLKYKKVTSSAPSKLRCCYY
jgi:hypothetical protein